MLQGFIRFSEFTEFRFHLGKTALLAHKEERIVCYYFTCILAISYFCSQLVKVEKQLSYELSSIDSSILKIEIRAHIYHIFESVFYENTNC